MQIYWLHCEKSLRKGPTPIVLLKYIKIYYMANDAVRLTYTHRFQL